MFSTTAACVVWLSDSTFDHFLRSTFPFLPFAYCSWSFLRFESIAVCLTETASFLPAASNSACVTSCWTKLSRSCLLSAEPAFGQALLAALYCTQTCAISVL